MKQTSAEWMRSVLDQYEGPLIAYATRLTGDSEAGRDVAQEVFLRFCSDEAPRDESHVRAWLFTVCRNRALDIRRKENRMTRLTEEQARATQDEAPPPDMLAESTESSCGLLALVANLPNRQQEAIRLRFQHGLNYREISTVMSTSIGNVGYLIHTAISELRNRLNGTTPSAASDPTDGRINS